jgi:hypothetical protein
MKGELSVFVHRCFKHGVYEDIGIGVIQALGEKTQIR